MKKLLLLLVSVFITFNVASAACVVNYGPNLNDFTDGMDIPLGCTMKFQVYGGGPYHYVQSVGGAVTYFAEQCTAFPVPGPCTLNTDDLGVGDYWMFDYGGSVYNLYFFQVVPGGGGVGSTSTIDFSFSTSSIIDLTGAFGLGSTTIPFGSIDFGACDVTSININPFATSSLTWGTFNVPSCVLQSVKFIFFGLDGFDTYRITNFVNTSSSTLPFVFFKFVSSALVYINPLTGELINLPTGTSTNVFEVPLFSTSSPTEINIMASTSNLITIPNALDNVFATIEFVAFAITWGLLFRFILV